MEQPGPLVPPIRSQLRARACPSSRCGLLVLHHPLHRYLLPPHPYISSLGLVLSQGDPGPDGPRGPPGPPGKPVSVSSVTSIGCRGRSFHLGPAQCLGLGLVSTHISPCPLPPDRAFTVTQCWCYIGVLTVSFPLGPPGTHPRSGRQR